jgi:predicted alpha-1,2-mannosidase
VQLSPDTFNDGWDWCSGYHISDSSIMGFSHTHLSGTGCGDLLDFLVMAGTGPVKIVSGTREDPGSSYRSRFSHDDEVMTPGFYSVTLKDYGIRAELTSTERAGLHRYTFPASEEAYLVLDLQHCYGGAQNVRSAELMQRAPDTLAGSRITSAWDKGRHACCTLQVSKTPDRIVFYQNDQEVAAPPASLTGKNLKCVLHFKTRAGEAILVKTGISAVSATAAGNKLKHEIPGWDFESIRAQAQELWRRQLSKIRVTTNNDAHKKTFYTGIYHMSLGPKLFDDVDGRYRGMDARSTSCQMASTTTQPFRPGTPIAPRIRRTRSLSLRVCPTSPTRLYAWPSRARQACRCGRSTAPRQAP